MIKLRVVNLSVDKRRKQSTANNRQTRTCSNFSHIFSKSKLGCHLLIRVKRIKNRMSNIFVVVIVVVVCKEAKREKKNTYNIFQSRSLQILFSVLCSSFLFPSLISRLLHFSLWFSKIYLWKKWRCTPILEKRFCEIYRLTHNAHAKFMPWNWDLAFLYYYYSHWDPISCDCVCDRNISNFSLWINAKSLNWNKLKILRRWRCQKCFAKSKSTQFFQGPNLQTARGKKHKRKYTVRNGNRQSN